MDKKLQEIVGVTTRLVTFRTTEDRPDEIKACFEYIKEYFKNTNLHISEFNFKNKQSMVISFNKKKRFDILLNGHVDVVDGQSTQFTPCIGNGVLLARGAYDMKSSIATMMVIMKEFSGMKTPPSLGLMIVSDEEIDGRNGTIRLIKKGYKPKFCIIGEPTGLHIETKHKGHLVVKLKAYGASAHGSRPWRGRNAIDMLIKQYQKILSEIPQATPRKKWAVSVNASSINSNFPYNVIPSKAEMVVAFRPTEFFTDRMILALLKKHKVKYERIVNSSMMLNDNKEKYIRALKEVVKKHVSKRVKYIKSSGGSDGKFFTQYGIRAVNFGPVGGNHHRSKEYVNIESIGTYYKILTKYILANSSKTRKIRKKTAN